jgi:adenylate cyclase
VVSQLLEEGELSLEGELREVTVLLSDIRGYTALTEELGAEEVVSLLNEYFGILVDAVVQREGVIDKFMGDAMLCWFGAPVPQEDHRQRAMGAARDILERLGEWNAARVARGLEPVATGIGLATGCVVVGNIGSPQRLEYTAIGDAVNLASRLCSKADAGEILVTRSIQQVVEIPLEPMGPIQVKGVREPVEVHRLKIPIVAT